jgi:Uncharacterised nucleotidyltransferase
MVADNRPNFRKAFMAISKVDALLRKVTRALDRAKISYAVIGGNAVAAWVATVDPNAIRSTKDVDLLLQRDAIQAAERVLSKIGFELVEVLGVSMFIQRSDPSPKRGVHIVFSKELIRAHYTHPAPDVKKSVRAADGFLVVNLPELVKMKLQSFRLTDQVHLQDLRAMRLLTPRLVRSLPADLRKRLTSIPGADTN